MAKSVDPDQMTHFVVSALGLHCLQRPICPSTLGYYGSPFFQKKWCAMTLPSQGSHDSTTCFIITYLQML